MDIDFIKENPVNPRKISNGAVDRAAESITKFPKMMEKRPIVVDSINNPIVLGGNVRLRALHKLGIKSVPDNWVVFADEWTEEEKKEFIIKDNLQYGEWDYGVLADWDIEKLEEWGLDVPDFEVKDENEEDYFEYKDTVATDIIEGDLFKIGPHRVLCGDSTNSDQVARIMDGSSADLVFTDPPYELENTEIYSCIPLISKNTNILIFASDKQIPFIFESVGKYAEFKRLYTLDTGIASPTNNDVYVNHIALLRFKFGQASKFNNIHDSGRSIVKTDYRKNLKEGGLHPHQKSLATLQLFIEYWSNAGHIVVDLFGGSGSTLIASHRINRICYIIEKYPKNCQIIIDRLKNLDNQLEISKLP